MARYCFSRGRKSRALESSPFSLSGQSSVRVHRGGWVARSVANGNPPGPNRKLVYQEVSCSYELLCRGGKGRGQWISHAYAFDRCAPGVIRPCSLNLLSFRTYIIVHEHQYPDLLSASAQHPSHPPTRVRGRLGRNLVGVLTGLRYSRTAKRWDYQRRQRRAERGG